MCHRIRLLVTHKTKQKKTKQKTLKHSPVDFTDHLPKYTGSQVGKTWLGELEILCSAEGQRYIWQFQGQLSGAICISLPQRVALWAGIKVCWFGPGGPHRSFRAGGMLCIPRPHILGHLLPLKAVLEERGGEGRPCPGGLGCSISY